MPYAAFLRAPFFPALSSFQRIRRQPVESVRRTRASHEREHGIEEAGQSVGGEHEAVKVKIVAAIKYSPFNIYIMKCKH